MSDHYDPALLRKLCEEASCERDSQKLLELMKQIGDLLDKKTAATAKSDQENKDKKSA